MKKAAVKAKSVILLGTAVVGTLLMSFTTVEDGEESRKEKPENTKVEVVLVKEAGHNLVQVVKELTIIDPAWAKNLPKAKKGKKTVKKAVSIVTYGVVEEDSGRLYLTDEEINLEDGICGEEAYPCKVVFDTAMVTIHTDPVTGRRYIDYVGTNPPYTAHGTGPFTPAP